MTSYILIKCPSGAGVTKKLRAAFVLLFFAKYKSSKDSHREYQKAIYCLDLLI